MPLKSGAPSTGRYPASAVSAAAARLTASDRKLSPDDRLVGVDVEDFPAKFGDYPLKCSPSVDWFFKQGGIPLTSAKLIHVVQVPKSWRAPHSIEVQPGTFRFPKRTNKGTEYMPISEVQAMFLGLQEKRRKLEMLRAELAFLSSLLEQIKPVRVEAPETSTITPPMEVLQALVGETFVLLERHPKLLGTLNQVRRFALLFQEEHALFHRQLSLVALRGALAVGLVELETRNHNARLSNYCDWMGQALAAAQEHLKPLLT